MGISGSGPDHLGSDPRSAGQTLGVRACARPGHARSVAGARSSRRLSRSGRQGAGGDAVTTPLLVVPMAVTSPRGRGWIPEICSVTDFGVEVLTAFTFPERAVNHLGSS